MPANRQRSERGPAHHPLVLISETQEVSQIRVPTMELFDFKRLIGARHLIRAQKGNQFRPIELLLVANLAIFRKRPVTIFYYVVSHRYLERSPLPPAIQAGQEAVHTSCCKRSL